ncbi:ATP-binding protein [Thermoproteota archaeon]
MEDEEKEYDIDDTQPIKYGGDIVPRGMDFYEVRDTLEDYIEDLQEHAGDELVIHPLRCEKKRTDVTITHIIESEDLEKGKIIDVYDLFNELYDDERSFDEKGIRKFIGKYNFSHKGVSHDGLVTKGTNIGVSYVNGGMIWTNGKSEKIGPHVSVEFTTKYLDQRDVEFNKALYLALIPEPKKRTDPRSDQIRELGIVLEEELAQHTWDTLAGYDDTKEEIVNKIIRPNLMSKSFKKLREVTRKCPDQVTYNCFLFSGTYGVGKTDMARVVANELGYPFIEVPLQTIFTKWYGESPKKLGRIFDRARKYGKAVLFLDEIDCISGSRDSGMHEESQKVMSVLMSNTAKTKVGDDLVIIGATNKRDNLDGALLRRFKKEVKFPLPSHEDLVKIYHHYALQLGMKDLEALARQSVGFSPFDVLNVCDIAESLFLSDVQQGLVSFDMLLGEDYYFKGLDLTHRTKTKEAKSIGFGR